jgi:hypothetical protein
MLVTVVCIRKVRMFMIQRFVNMRVRMGFLAIPLKSMSVLVMSIVHVGMMMFHERVPVPVGMPFEQM